MDTHLDMHFMIIKVISYAFQNILLITMYIIIIILVEI